MRECELTGIGRLQYYTSYFCSSVGANVLHKSLYLLTIGSVNCRLLSPVMKQTLLWWMGTYVRNASPANILRLEIYQEHKAAGYFENILSLSKYAASETRRLET
jgi:hypothetical protein